MNKAPDPPSLSILSPSLHKRYISYGGVQRKAFKSLFFAMWSFLWPVSRLDPVAHSYLLPAVLERSNPLIYLGDFYILSRLWLFSGGGVLTLDSRFIKMTSAERHRIPILMRAGLLMRTSFDPLSPRLVSHRATQKVFISFTPQGSAFYRGVVSRLNKAVRDDVLSVQVGNK